MPSLFSLSLLNNLSIFPITTTAWSHWSISYRWVKAQVANVAGDNLFFLEGLRDTKCVVDHCLLDRIHLRDRNKRSVETTLVLVWFYFPKWETSVRQNFIPSKKESIFSVSILVTNYHLIYSTCFQAVGWCRGGWNGYGGTWGKNTALFEGDRYMLVF